MRTDRFKCSIESYSHSNGFFKITIMVVLFNYDFNLLFVVRSFFISKPHIKIYFPHLKVFIEYSINFKHGLICHCYSHSNQQLTTHEISMGWQN